MGHQIRQLVQWFYRSRYLSVPHTGTAVECLQCVSRYIISLQAIDGGTGMLVVSLNNQQIFQNAIATCGDTAVSLPLGLGQFVIHSVACPVAGGSIVSIGTTFTIPVIAPEGTYGIKLTTNDDGGAGAYCVLATVTL